jgi:hypothetical protein
MFRAPPAQVATSSSSVAIDPSCMSGGVTLTLRSDGVRIDAH